MPTIWKDKVVVVTGGSKGLGAATVMAFARRGATVISVARSQESQDDFATSIKASDGITVHAVLADVTGDQSVQACVESIVEQHGRIDVWVNNVGISGRANFREAKVEDYHHLMEVNFYSAIRCTNSVLPHLESTSGSIVNIGSLAAKTGFQFVAPYVASKHALAGFAHQLRIEGPNNVHSLFVCPGPIQRADSGSRYDDEASAKGLDAQAAKPGAGAKVSGIAPEKIAEAIVIGCEKRKPEIVMPGKARLLFSILQLWPKLGDRILSRFSG